MTGYRPSDSFVPVFDSVLGISFECAFVSSSTQTSLTDCFKSVGESYLYSHCNHLCFVKLCLLLVSMLATLQDF